jgi:hypothetical protein
MYNYTPLSSGAFVFQKRAVLSFLGLSVHTFSWAGYAPNWVDERGIKLDAFLRDWSGLASFFAFLAAQQHLFVFTLFRLDNNEQLWNHFHPSHQSALSRLCEVPASLNMSISSRCRR